MTKIDQNIEKVTYDEELIKKIMNDLTKNSHKKSQSFEVDVLDQIDEEEHRIFMTHDDKSKNETCILSKDLTKNP